MLNRDSVVNLFEMNGQNPCYLENSKTLIETKSAGAFYILEYNGTGRVGWGVYDKDINMNAVLQQLIDTFHAKQNDIMAEKLRRESTTFYGEV